MKAFVHHRFYGGPAVRCLGAAMLAWTIASALPCLAQNPSTGKTQSEPRQSDPRARLETIQNNLIDQAMQAPTRVRSGAWVDQRGVLHEHTEVRSDMRLRGVRVMSYLDAMQPQAADSNTSTGAAANAVPGKANPTAQCSDTPPRYKRSMRFAVDSTPNDGRNGSYFMPRLRQQVEQAITREFSADSDWVLSRDGNLNNSYERAVYGNNGGEAAYVMSVSLELGEAQSDWRVRDDVLPGQPIRMHLRLHDSRNGKLVWALNAMLRYPAQTVSMHSRPLPTSLLQELERSLSFWRSQLDWKLGCEPLQFVANEATPVNAEGAATQNSSAAVFAVAAGSRVGVRVGDKLMLINPERIPGRILEKSSIDQMAVAEVVAVDAERALVQTISGPRPKRGEQLVALPF